MPRDGSATGASAAATPARQLPVTLSCETCRLRKIKCTRLEGTDSCSGCRKKGIQCVFLHRPKTRRRTGKNVEAARAQFGSTTPAPSGVNEQVVAARTPLPLVSAQERLVRQELVGAFGGKIVDVYVKNGHDRSAWPEVDLPLVDLWDLKSRYNRCGQRLDQLDIADQLVFRIICSYAAQQCLPDQLAGSSRRGITHGIKTEFESFADSIGIWRQTDAANLVPLFLGYKAKETEDLAAEGATPYLEAAIAQWRRLARRDSPASRSTTESLSTSLRWSLVVADCYGAAERRHAPLLSRTEIETMLSRPLEDDLPDMSRMQIALSVSASASMCCIYDAILAFALLAHDVASCSSSLACSAESLQPLWSRLDSLYAWAQDALLVCSLSSAEGCNLLRVYATDIWSSAVTLEFSIAEHIRSILSRIAAPATSAVGLTNTDHLADLVSLCATANRRILTAITSNLRTVTTRHNPPLHTLGVMPALILGIGRVLDIGQAFAGAPAEDRSLFPTGPQEKLGALNFLLAEIRRLETAYPSAKMDATLSALNEGQSRLINSLSVSGLEQIRYHLPSVSAPDDTQLDASLTAPWLSFASGVIPDGASTVTADLYSASSATRGHDQLSLEFRGFEGSEADWLASL